MLTDRFGETVRMSDLAREIAVPTIGSVRSPLTGYPGDGLDPQRLAAILRAADMGEIGDYLELAETIEERDPHYAGVIATRKRSVAQIPVSVEAASDDPRDVARADMVREWLRRDELTEEMFHILDCLAKGVSFTEIIWARRDGHWWPERLEWRDPRWFRFDPKNLTTPQLLDEAGQRQPLPAFKFIAASIQAKSGLPIRSGLARLGAWAWMFKAFTLRDWAIFTQTYGTPLRVGKWSPGASDEDKDTLFRAVANIAGDCAAIIPETMSIEFIEAAGKSSSIDLYERRADWIDRQMSKAILGQTATTDAIAGGHAVGQEHRQVQKDIETADARALAAILNRDLIRPWIDLEYGPQRTYPRLVIAHPEVDDVAGWVDALAKLVPLGLRVTESEVRDRLNFPDPEDGAVILGGAAPAPSRTAPPAGPQNDADDGAGAGATEEAASTSLIKRFLAEIKRHQRLPGTEVARNAEEGSLSEFSASDATDEILPVIEIAAEADIAVMLSQIEAMLGAAGSLAEARAMFDAAFVQTDASPLAATLAEAFRASWLAGRVALEDAGG